MLDCLSSCQLEALRLPSGVMPVDIAHGTAAVTSSQQAEAGSTWRASLEGAWWPLLRAKGGPWPRHAALLRQGAPIRKWRLLCWRSHTCSIAQAPSPPCAEAPYALYLHIPQSYFGHTRARAADCW